MLEEWQRTLPSCTGFWWLELSPPVVVYVLTSEKENELGEFWHPGEGRWRFLEDFRDHRWAGPLLSLIHI